jgi:hypothetical protein
MPSPRPETIPSPDERADLFVLKLAPDPSLIVTARLFGAGLARLAGCREEQVDDVKLAISEASAVVLGGKPPSLDVRARRTSERIAFSVGPVRGSRPPTAGPMGGSRAESPLAGSLPRGLDLVALIFDDARIESRNGDGSALRFSVPVDRSDAPG